MAEFKAAWEREYPLVGGIRCARDGAITFGYLVGRPDALQQHKRRSAGIPC